MPLYSCEQLQENALRSAISNVIKRLWLLILNINWFLNEMVKALIQQGIKVRVMGLSCGSVMLREGLLRCNSVSLLALIALRTCLIRYDFKLP